MEVKSAIKKKEIPFYKKALICAFWGMISAICFTYFISKLGIYTSGVSLTINGIVAMMQTVGWITLDQRDIVYWTIFTLFTIGLMIFTFKKIGKDYAYLTLYYLIANIATGFVLSLVPMFANYQLFEAEAYANFKLTFDSTGFTGNLTDSFILFDAMHHDIGSVENAIGVMIKYAASGFYDPDNGDSLLNAFTKIDNTGDATGWNETWEISNDTLKILNYLEIGNGSNLGEIETITIQGMGSAYDENGWLYFDRVSVEVYFSNGEGWNFYVTNAVYANLDGFKIVALNANEHVSEITNPDWVFTASNEYNILDYALGQTVIAALIYGIIQSIAVGNVYNTGGSTGGIDPISYYISMHSKSGKNVSFYTLIWSASNIVFFVFVNDWLLFDYVRAPHTLEATHGLLNCIFGAPMIASFTYLSIFTIYVGFLFPRGKNVEIDIYTRIPEKIKEEFIYEKWGRSFTIKMAKGGHGAEMTIITVLCNKQESYDILKLVNFVDQNAMIIVKNVDQLYSAHYSGSIKHLKFDYEHIKQTYAEQAAQYEEIKESAKIKLGKNSKTAPVYNAAMAYNVAKAALAAKAAEEQKAKVAIIDQIEAEVDIAGTTTTSETNVDKKKPVKKSTSKSTKSTTQKSAKPKSEKPKTDKKI